MKLQQKDYNVETSLQPLRSASFRCDYTPQAMAHAFEMQTIRLYDEPEYAAVRELVSNMSDSHNRAGNADKKIKVSLPTNNVPKLTFSDSGTGMDFKDLTDCFMQFGGSDKQDTNEEFGAYGWGAKSIVCLCDTANIDSVKDGVLYECVWYMGKDRLPKLDLLAQKATDQPNGTTIEMAIPITKIGLIHANIQRIGLFLEPGLEIVGEPIDISRYTGKELYWTDKESKEDWIHIPELGCLIKEQLQPDVLSYAITVNGLLYGVKNELPKDLDYKREVLVDKKNVNNYYSHVTVGLYSCDGYKPSLIIPFNIGELEFTTSRDSIKDTEGNQNLINARLEVILTNWISLQEHIYNESKTLMDFYNKSIWDKNIFYNPGASTYHQKRGNYQRYCQRYCPNLPVVEKGLWIASSDRYWIESVKSYQGNKVINGLQRIYYVDNSKGIKQLVNDIELKTVVVNPVYVFYTKGKDNPVPNESVPYYLLEFSSFNTRFKPEHSIMVDLWHYPASIKRRYRKDKTVEVKATTPTELTFEKAVRQKLLRQTSIPIKSCYWNVAPNQYSSVITELPKSPLYVYVDSKDNNTLGRTVVTDTLATHDISTVYVTTPKIQEVLPDTFTEVNTLIEHDRTNLFNKYGVLSEILCGSDVSVLNDVDTFNFSIELAKKLKLRPVIRTLNKLMAEKHLVSLSTINSVNNDLSKLYASHSKQDYHSDQYVDNYHSCFNSLLSTKHRLALATILSTVKELDKHRVLELVRYLSSVKDFKGKLYDSTSLNIILQSIK